MHMCHILHLHSAANPPKLKGDYPACQSNAAQEETNMLCVDMKGGKIPPGGKKQWVVAVHSSILLT